MVFILLIHVDIMWMWMDLFMNVNEKVSTDVQTFSQIAFGISFVLCGCLGTGYVSFVILVSNGTTIFVFHPHSGRIRCSTVTVTSC